MSVASVKRAWERFKRGDDDGDGLPEWHFQCPLCQGNVPTRFGLTNPQGDSVCPDCEAAS